MKRNEAGFGLLEVMIAVGLTGIIAYVVMQQSTISSKQQSKASFNEALNSLVTSMQKDLAKNENCSVSLAGKSFGTIDNPTYITEIKKGMMDVLPPHDYKPGPVIYSVRQKGSTEVYIENMQLIRRPSDNKKVLRVFFKAGDPERKEPNGKIIERDFYGGKEVSRDFLIASEEDKINTNTIVSCKSESSSQQETACYRFPGGVWNEELQKCDITGLVKKPELMQLWTLSNGGVGTLKPPSQRKQVECRCDEKQCSRARKPCTCALPDCENSNWQYGVKRWTYSRNEKQINFINEECMYAAHCEFNSQPAGWMVKPEANSTPNTPTIPVEPTNPSNPTLPKLKPKFEDLR
jgi:type II secretory pathway pseudopilin PulG